MAKPATLDGYSDQHTVDCERVLVTLLHALADRHGRRGLATLCLGGGDAVALAVERRPA